MSALAAAIVAALEALLPLIGAAAGPTIDGVITFLIQAIPLVQQEITAVGPSIMNLITALKSNTAITEAQLQTLATAEASYDSAFEAAATAAGFPSA